MLRFFKTLFLKDRRHYPRQLVNGRFDLEMTSKEGVTMNRTVDVIDISLNGAAFIYEGSPYDVAKFGLIRLYKGMPAALGFKTVSDIECSKESTFRRRGVKFDWTGFLGKKQLIAFSEEYGGSWRKD